MILPINKCIFIDMLLPSIGENKLNRFCSISKETNSISPNVNPILISGNF